MVVVGGRRFAAVLATLLTPELGCGNRNTMDTRSIVTGYELILLGLPAYGTTKEEQEMQGSRTEND